MSTTLLSRFEPLLALAMHARDTAEGRAVPWDALASDMHGAVLRERQAMPPEGIGPACLEDCRMAVYILIDEILMESPRTGEGLSAGWYPHSLQLRFLRTDTGGVLFYERLEALLDRIIASGRRPASSGMILPGMRGAPGVSDMPEGRAGTAPDAPESVLELPLPEAGPSIEDPLLDKLLAASALLRSEPGLAEALPEAGALPIYALCLLYGFRGRYHEPDKAAALEGLRKASLPLCLSLLGKGAEAPTPAKPAARRLPPVRSLLIRNGWFLFLVLAPLFLTGVWYVVCADIVARAAR